MDANCASFLFIYGVRFNPRARDGRERKGKVYQVDNDKFQSTRP